jgi:hypothetical protein
MTWRQPRLRRAAFYRVRFVPQAVLISSGAEATALRPQGRGTGVLPVLFSHGQDARATFSHGQDARAR